MEDGRSGVNIWIGFADLFVGLMLFMLIGLTIILQQYGRSPQEVHALEEEMTRAQQAIQQFGSSADMVMRMEEELQKLRAVLQEYSRSPAEVRDLETQLANMRESLQQAGNSPEEVQFSGELVRTLNMAKQITESIKDELQRRLPKGIPSPLYAETSITIPSAALFRSFGFDDFLDEESKKRLLTAIGEALREALATAGDRHRFLRIVIEGHTDSAPIKQAAVTPAIQTNWELSGRRATGVLRFFEKLGVNAQEYNMVAMGLADTIPIASNDTEEGKAKNRRIVIHVEPDIGAIRTHLQHVKMESEPWNLKE